MTDAVVADEAEHHAERQQFGYSDVDLLHQGGGALHIVIAHQVHCKPENETTCKKPQSMTSDFPLQL